MINKILLINPPYENFGVKESVSNVSVSLSLAMLGGIAKSLCRDVQILDLNLMPTWEENLLDCLDEFSPDLVGITFTTPLIRIADEIARKSKQFIGNRLTVIGGGPHASSDYIETLSETCFDAVAVGEAETSFKEFLINGDFKRTVGWAYKAQDNSIVFSGRRKSHEDINTLPFGAFDLFSAKKYIYPRESARENPVCLIETSRGCYGRCIYCNKNIFGHNLRFKSAERVVDEIEYILSQGFKEIHIADDSFTANHKHTKKICEEIISRKLIFPWVPRSGVRVDKVSRDLLEIMKNAGCYHVPFGIESGNQDILDFIKKGITLKQVENAVSIANSLGLETTGYFMFGFPGETIEKVKRTVDFALQLNLDHFKFGVAIPLPGTDFFAWLKSRNKIKTLDWEKYTYSTPPWDIYDLPDLQKDELIKIEVLNQNLLEIANVSIHR